MWLSSTVFDEDRALGAPFHWSHGSDDLNMSDGLFLSEEHLDLGQGSGVLEVLNPSQSVLESISLAGLCEPTPPDYGHQQGVPYLQSRLAGLHLDPSKLALGLLFVMLSNLSDTPGRLRFSRLLWGQATNQNVQCQYGA